MVRRDLTLLTLALVALPAVGSSGAAAASPDCRHWQQTAATQLQMNVCSTQDAQRSAADVQTRYTAYRATLSGAARAALDTTQRAWAAYRDAYCREKSASADGGSMQPMILNTCRALLDRRRATDLRNDRSGF